MDNDIEKFFEELDNMLTFSELITLSSPDLIDQFRSICGRIHETNVLMAQVQKALTKDKEYKRVISMAMKHRMQELKDLHLQAAWDEVTQTNENTHQIH